MSFQNVTILGNLGRDPEIRKTQAGAVVANFTVAVNEGSGDRKTTTWFQCVAWEKTGELVDKYFRKGNQILCNGRMRLRTWTDQSGVEKTTWELLVNQIGFVNNGDTARDGGDDRSDRGQARESRDDRGRGHGDEYEGRGRGRSSNDGSFDDPPARSRSRSSRDLNDDIPF